MRRTPIRKKKSRQIGTVAFAIALLTIALYTALQTNPITSTTGDHPVQGLVLPEDMLGQPVSLNEAELRATFQLSVPTYLPRQTALARVYVSNDGKMVRLFYDNPAMADAQAFGDSLPFRAAIVLYIQASPTNPLLQVLGGNVPPIIIQGQDNNGTTIFQTILQQPVGNVVQVCGVDAFGRDPHGTEPGILVWWKNGVEYLLEAKLPLSDLTLIAASTC